MKAVRRLSLPTQFVLVLLLGAILPLGLVGLWLARSAERSGEQLVLERLRRDLSQIVSEIGLRWVRYRSSLLSLAEHAEVLVVLRQPASGEVRAPAGIEQLYVQLTDVVETVVIRDQAGLARWRLVPPPEPPGSPQRVIAALLPVSFGIYEPASGAPLGTLDAQLRVSALLPTGAGWVGVGGAVLGIFDRAKGSSLLPLTIDPERFRQPAFTWADEVWRTVHQELSEPPLDVVLAAPLAPVTATFAQATRRGTLALIAVAAAALLLTSLVTGGLTRSLGRLAHAADAVAHGDLDRRLPDGSSDEIQRVTRTFNAMAESLQRTLRELSQRQSLAAVGEFAASLAHEVRNPLTAIRVDLQRAEEKAADAGVRELIGRALRAVERLDATVTGALRIARSGNVTARPLDLRESLRAAMESATYEFRARGARLEPLPDGSGTVTVKGDAAALEQLFLNLLLNAAQALDQGGRAGVALDLEDHWVRVRVWDTGPGMTPESVERAFEPFYSTKPNGTGLGLAIARRIAEAHGGELRIKSEPGRGTAARLTLPRA